MKGVNDADVIVLGGGGSGLSAAIAAAEHGKRVILFEKAAALGGSTRLSVGSFAAAGTSLQRRAGVTDSNDQFIDDLISSNGPLEAHENVRLREVLVGQAAGSLEWLQRLGVQFFGPTHEHAYSNRRLHNVVPGSRAYIHALCREALRCGVEIRVNAAGEQLLTDARGAVTGVRAAGTWRASAVVLASGDYSGSTELRKNWISDQTARLPSLNPVNTGDGFTMALKVGADVRNAWRVIEELRFRPPYRKNVLTMLPPSRRLTQGMRIAVERAPGPIVGALAKYAFTGWVAPSRELFDHGAILVNARGERFTNEHENAARALADEPYNACYVLFDGVVADEFSAWPNPVSTFSGIGYAYLRDYKRIRPDVFHSGATLEELELKIGAPSGSLGATVARYNHAISDDREDQFGRGSRGRGLHRPPFFALGPAHGVVTITDGGLSVDDDCRVLRDGDPIPGLYAAGSAGQGGLILKAHGLHIAWAMTSGRVAAIAATLDS